MNMLRPRIIVTLLISNGGIVKTTNFKNPKYIGDPVNVVKIFNEKEIDELFVVDIDATKTNAQPNYKLIERMAKESSMPFCFGGGISTPEQAGKIISLGVEKIAVSSAVIKNSHLLTSISPKVGSQSVVAVIDVKLLDGVYKVWTNNGLKDTSKNLTDVVLEFSKENFGELVVNSIDRDGTQNGYDLNLAAYVNSNIGVPVSTLGGCGNFEHMVEVVKKCGLIGVSAGSLFCFKGKFRAVLPNYVTSDERQQIYNSLHVME